MSQSLRLRLRDSLRQSGGRFATGFYGRAEARPYLNGKNNDKNKTTANADSLRE